MSHSKATADISKLHLYHSASEFSDEEWNSGFDGAQLLMHRSSLLALEENSYRNFKPLYFLYKEGSTLIPAYVQVYPLSEKSVKQILNLNGWATAITSFLFQLRNGLSAKKSYLLVYGSPLASGICGSPQKSMDKYPELLGEVIKLIIQRIGEDFQSLGNPFMILAKDLHPANLKKFSFPFNDRKAQILPLEPVMKLEIDPQWHTFRDYLEALSSKYRIRAQAALRKFENVKWEELESEQIDLLSHQIEELYNKVEVRAKIRLIQVKPKYFSVMKQTLGRSFIFRAYYYKKELIGFTSGIFHDGYGEAHLIGFDDSLNHKMSLYQNLLYAYVSDAIHNRVSVMSFGRTATEIKSTLGATPEEPICATYFQDSGYEHAAQIALSKLSDNQFVIRRPFKHGSS